MTHDQDTKITYHRRTEPEQETYDGGGGIGRRRSRVGVCFALDDKLDDAGLGASADDGGF